MSDSPMSPLQREFVLIDKPLANRVGFQVETTSLIQVTFNGVPTECLNGVKKSMDKIVEKHTQDKTWDMERIDFLIARAIQNKIKDMEERPDFQIFGHMIGHQLYGNSEEDLRTRMNELELIRRLRSEPASFWSGLVKKYFTKPHVAVIGIPSEKMVEQVAKEEKARLEQQRQKLGKEGIKSYTNSRMYDVLVLEKFHEKVAMLCDSQPTFVIEKLEEVRSTLLSVGVNAHFVCDVDLIKGEQFVPHQWSFVEKCSEKSEKFTVVAGESLQPGFVRKKLLLGVSGSESSFIYQTSIVDCGLIGEELIPTMIFAQYLSQYEGPLWRGIRGEGLAYGAKIRVHPEKRTISLSLTRCAEPVRAYERAKKIMINVLKNGVLAESEFDAAKRSLICEMVKCEQTSGICSRQFYASVWTATIQDVLLKGGPEVAKLFEEYALAIAVHPSKISEIMSAFTDIEETALSSLNYIPSSLA
ncbi:hypothetical protein NECAME_12419 [Necator americanus]|uniref:Peptidase M16 inactive domain protein n=1 Tax=Necator americanus TaxID=51031 RepID=W2T1C8_NECAM|nr:hypothetical protein NECAME_12419 [Necator americanus]ETN75364.1 hypothetical protein NECAME_12419 [Necator americanus]